MAPTRRTGQHAAQGFLSTATIILVLLALAGTAAFVFRLSAAQWVLHRILAANGYPEARFSLTELGAKQAVVQDVVLGDGAPSVRRIAVTYNLDTLWRGKLNTLTVDGVSGDINLAPRAGQTPPVSLPSFKLNLTPYLNTDATVTVTDVAFVVRNSPLGNLRVTGSADADFSRPAKRIALKIAAAPLDQASPLQDFSFDGTGTVAGDGLDIKGPTKAAAEGGKAAGWTVKRLDYDGPAHLQIVGRTAQFDLSAPVSFDILQILPAGQTGPPLALNASAGHMTVDADWNDSFTGHAQISGGSFTLAAWSLHGDDVVLDIPFAGNRLSGPVGATARLSDQAKTPRFSPLDARLTVRPEADVLIIDAAVTPPGRTAEITFSGRYEPASRSGRFAIGPNLLHFAAGGLQPGDLSPLLSSFAATNGPVELAGDITFTPDQPIQSGATVTFDEVDTSFGALSVVGVKGTLNIVDLVDPHTPPGQVLTARKVTEPLPLDSPKLTLHWVRSGDNPLITIQSAQGKFAGGAIRLGNTPVHLKATEHQFKVIFDRLSLETLFKKWAGGRISGAGSISGTIPVTLGSDGPIITDGLLKGDDPGVLKVNWGDARQALENQGQEVALMVHALEDFQYSRLETVVRRPSDRELSFHILLEGKNPDVLNGHPFRLNINLTGNLESVLHALASGQALTQDLLRGHLQTGK